jgi:NitT/TauT family transport system permease protein
VLVAQLLVLAAFLGYWEYTTASDKQAAFMFGSPSAIAGFLGKMAADGSLWRDTWVTGMETVLGFIVGNCIGTVIGLSLWYSRFVSAVVHPFIIALGSIPTIALAPIIIIWFGTGLISKIAMATLSVVVVAVVTSYKGAVGVDPDQINLMRTLGAGKFPIFRKLVVPASASSCRRRRVSATRSSRPARSTSSPRFSRRWSPPSSWHCFSPSWSARLNVCSRLGGEPTEQ